MLVEKDALKNWTVGSCEWLRQETYRAIKEGKGSEIDFTWKLLATYPNHAIIVSDKGSFYRCRLQELDGFKRKLVGVEAIDGPKVYHEGEEAKFYQDKTRNLVSSILEGTGVGDLTDLMLQEDGKLNTAQAITEQLQSLAVGRTLWSSYYQENEHTIQRANWRVEQLIREGKYRSDMDPERLANCYRYVSDRAKGGVTGLLEVMESVAKYCEAVEYWLSKLSNESEQPSSYGATMQSLVECLQRIDMLVTYAEGLRGRR